LRSVWSLSTIAALLLDRSPAIMFTGSLVALVTPMRGNDQIDYECLGRLIDWHVESGTAALVVAGTTGESATLDKDEHIDLITAAIELAGGRIRIIAGTGSNSTRQTIELSEAVGRLDIAAYLIVTPYYNKPTQEGLVRHFSAIADAVDKPIMLYNVPGRTGVDLLPAAVARLAAHPGIFGIKEATGEVERVATLRETCGDDFRLYSGDDATGREFMLAGGHGVVSVTANVAPQEMSRMCELAIGGDAAGADEIDAALADLHRDLFIESNPIPVKWALERMERIPAGLRLPLTRLTDEHQGIVEAALNRAGFL
jgi:4-hydroxy-tetrahydrodipicolinate synthase